jgi:tagatose-1,6-bisphosphate aldolase
VISLDALARPTGTFLMVAMDQRESLRMMLRERGRPDGDAHVERSRSRSPARSRRTRRGS